MTATPSRATSTKRNGNGYRSSAGSVNGESAVSHTQCPALSGSNGRGRNPPLPEIVHERGGRRGHALAAHRNGNDRRDRPDRHDAEQHPAVARVTRRQPAKRERRADPRHDDDRRLREPRQQEPDGPGDRQASGRAIPLPKIQGEQQEQDRRRRVHRVLLHFGAIPNEGNRDGIERDREGNGPPVEHPLGEPAEEEDAGDGAQEGEEPQRELGLTQQRDHHPLRQQKSPRRDLVEVERAGEQVAQRQPDDVAAEKDLVQPEGHVRGIRPSAQPDAEQDEETQESGHWKGRSLTSPRADDRPAIPPRRAAPRLRPDGRSRGRARRRRRERHHHRSAGPDPRLESRRHHDLRLHPGRDDRPDRGTACTPKNRATSSWPDLGRILAGEDYVGEWLGRHRDGRPVWVQIRTAAIRNAAGEPVGIRRCGARHLRAEAGGV